MLVPPLLKSINGKIRASDSFMILIPLKNRFLFNYIYPWWTILLGSESSKWNLFYGNISTEIRNLHPIHSLLWEGSESKHLEAAYFIILILYAVIPRRGVILLGKKLTVSLWHSVCKL